MALALTVTLTHVLGVNVREGEELWEGEGLREGEELGDALSPPRSVGYGGVDIVPAK